jgi:hypothetical protein
MPMKSGRDRLGKYMNSVEIMITPDYGITSTFRGILRIAGSCGREVVTQKYLLEKTNMIIESHWKVLNHDYLYRFHLRR